MHHSIDLLYILIDYLSACIYSLYPHIMATHPLPTLTEWAFVHVKDVFEGLSTEAIFRTFSKDLNATVNDKPFTYDDFVKGVTNTRTLTETGLKVKFLQAVEVAEDPATNRVRSSSVTHI